jgi:elongation factor Ts
MAGITAADVKALRERTGLPMMDCKNALAEAGGDMDQAVDLLRKRGKQVLDTRAGRDTDFGRFGIYADPESGVAGMVEVKCESAPVTQNEEFIDFANNMAKQLATGPGATTPEELLAQPDPGNEGTTLGETKDDMFNRIREVFNIGRMVRIEGKCGSYSHNAATVAGVLVEFEGEGNAESAKDICMHVAAMRPTALVTDDLDQAEVDKEREILREAALEEGKPENIVDKMVEGRLRNYYAECVLSEQAFVKDDKLTVAKFAEANGMKLKNFVHWVLGEE